MKKTLTILAVFISIHVGATNYYVAPTSATPAGNDANAGTISAPWATLDKACDNAQAGDTVFFRGGVYYPASESQLGRPAYEGTAGSPICFFNYPGETPIIDCINVTSDSFTYGIYSYSKDYIEVKGLTIRNLFQAHSDDVVQAMEFTYGAFVRIENCVVHDINGVGFGVHGIDTTYIINCDAYNLCDSLQPTVPGQNGTGFAIGTGRSWGVPRMYNSYALIQGCRAWNASDQGFASGGVGYMEFDNCWSWNNGLLYGDGIGFKYSISTSGDTINPLSTYIHNCIAADNGMTGYTPNNNGGTVFNGHYYNNLSYHNGYKPDLEYYDASFGYGFMILNYSDAFVAPNEMFSNNISYGNQRGNIYAADVYTHEYNSWDIPITVTAGDFVSLDTAELRTARNADNSLPTINFGRLATGSSLIDAGTNVGLPFINSAPDLGWIEYDEEIDSTLTDILTFTLTEQTGAATINSTAHTVAIEIDYTADITDLTPTITLSYGATVIPLSGVARDFTNPVPYTVTALDGVTHQEWTVTVTQEEEPVDPPTSSSKIVKLGGLILKL